MTHECKAGSCREMMGQREDTDFIARGVDMQFVRCRKRLRHGFKSSYEFQATIQSCNNNNISDNTEAMDYFQSFV